MTDYAEHMRTVMARLVLVIAVLLMPLGMGTASATAVQHHAASMPMQHCPEQDSRHPSKGAFAECTMACASALPAVDRIQDERIPYAALFVAASAVHELRGLHPETATPPPRIA